MLPIPTARSRGPSARSLLVAATCFLALAECQNSKIYWRANHAVAVLGDHLYIVGGTSTSPNSTSPNDGGWQPENRTMAVSLAGSWDTANAPITVADENGIAPVAQPSLWSRSDTDEILAWGGSWPLGWQGPSDAKLLHFKRDPKRGAAGSWSSTAAGKSSSGDIIFRQGAGSYTSCNGLGFYMGGFVAGTTDERWGPGDAALRGLIIYDMATGSWTNNTAEGFGFAGQNDGTHVDGAAVCLPTLGTDGKGIVVFLGGRQGTIAGHQINSKDLEMNKIFLYDIGSKKFYSQSTTGETPLKRGHLCAVAAKDGNTNAYEIFVFGGRGVNPADVRVLAVPGFTWFSGPAPNANTQTDRVDHACAVVGSGGRQMIAHGGVSSMRSGELQRNTADLWANNMKVLDMTTMSWGDSYNAAAPAYQQPGIVKNWYKDSGMPSVRWDKEETRRLFSDAFSGTVPSNNTTPSSPNTPSNPESSESPAGASAGAIAGGVVGGVAGLAAVGAAILYFFWYRPRQQRQRQRQQQSHKSPETGGSAEPDVPGTAGSETAALGAKELPSPVPQEVPATPNDLVSPISSHEMSSPSFRQPQEVDDHTFAVKQEKYRMPPEIIEQMRAKEMYQMPPELYHEDRPIEMHQEPTVRHELPAESVVQRNDGESK